MYENTVVSQRLNLKASNLDAFPSNVSNSDNSKLGKPSDLVYQIDAPPDLKVVSWPIASSLVDLKYYTYDKNGGQNSVIYVVENGIDLQNPVRALRSSRSLDYFLEHGALAQFIVTNFVLGI